MRTNRRVGSAPPCLSMHNAHVVAYERRSRVHTCSHGVQPKRVRSQEERTCPCSLRALLNMSG
jgi:hypothetical protein